MTFYTSVQYIRLAFHGIKTNATVVSVKHSGRFRTVTIRFTDETGKVIDVEDKNVSGVGRPEFGETVPIVYLPSTPEIFFAQGIKGYTSLFIGLCLVTISLMCVIAALREYQTVKTSR